jgi:Xaa-Pro aminopeptidase
MNAARLAEVARAHGVDAVVASSAVDFFYVGGFQSISQCLVGSEALALVPAPVGAPHLLVFPQSDLDLFVDGPARGSAFATYGEFIVEGARAAGGFEPPADALADILRSRRAFADPVAPLLEHLSALGLLTGRIAVQKRHMSAPSLARLEAGLGGAEVVDAGPLIAEARSVKGPHELALLTKAVHIAHVALAAAVERVQPGITERELARTFAMAVADQGAGPSHIIIGSGQRSALTHSPPSARVVGRGEVVRFDVGCTYEGYYSDIARTVVVGDAGQRVRDVFAALKAGEETAFGAIRPGVAASAVFKAAVDAVRAVSIPGYRRSHVGHAIGLDLYEPLLLRPAEDAVLKENMVLNVECPYYELGFSGVSIEDPVVVTASGCRRLADAPRELLVV